MHPNSMELWKRRFIEQVPEIFAEQTTVNEYEGRIRDLKQLRGRKEVKTALRSNFLGRSG